MRSALAIAGFHDMGENGNHSRAVFVFLDNLIHQGAGQRTLLAGKGDCVINAVTDDLFVIGPLNQFTGSQAVSPFNVFRRILRGNHNYRNKAQPATLFQGFEKLEAIHVWHYNVQQYQRKLLGMIL